VEKTIKLHKEVNQTHLPMFGFYTKNIFRKIYCMRNQEIPMAAAFHKWLMLALRKN